VGSREYAQSSRKKPPGRREIYADADSQQRRIDGKKTGKTTSLDDLNASNLSALLDEVVNNPIYRDNSRSIQKAIAKKNGLSVAADLLEQAFGLTHNPIYEAASNA